MCSVYLLASAFVTAVTIGCLGAEVTSIGCSSSNERCVSFRLCPSELKRMVQLYGAPEYDQELSRLKCQPEQRIDGKPTVCCQRRDIKCIYGGKEGVCVPRKNCPMQKSLTEQQKLAWSNQKPCYVHDKKEYLCCTNAKCVMHQNLCDPDPGLTPQRPSGYPNCTNNSISGSVVPETMCDAQDRLHRLSNSKRVCCAPPTPDRLISHPKAARLANMMCGMVDSVSKIQNGESTVPGEFPWMALLVYESSIKKRVATVQRTDLACGGTLIHPLYVLTARHCIATSRNAPKFVLLGIHDIQKYVSCNVNPALHCEEVQKISVVKGVYDTKVHVRNSDIGLLRLAREAELVQGRVLPICLPLYASLRVQMPESVLITGWGTTEKDILSNVLLKANTSVAMRGTECAQDFFICVGGKNDSNHCKGDSGGPYQAVSPFGGNTRFVQYGVISGGSAYCSEPNQYRYLGTEATQSGCKPNQHCVPFGHCRKERERLLPLFGTPRLTEEINRIRCTPKVHSKEKTYICCDSKCEFNNKPGVCMPRESCPTSKARAKRQQKAWSEQQPCYVHDQTEYLCCTNPHCVKQPALCDKPKPAMQRITSGFPACTGKGKSGSVVPEIMCDAQDQLHRLSNSKRVCCAPPTPDRLISHPKAARLANMACGTAGYTIKIQNGEFAHRGEFPWMALLVYKHKQTRCGGTLIHPSYVLTAKHCIKSNSNPTHVMLGVHDALDTPPCSKTTREPYCSQVQQISVAKHLRHDKFDIGLLRLASKAKLDPNSVFPICLPLYASLRMQMPESVIITGWGKTENEIVSNVLLKATTPVVKRDTECPNDNLICAGGKNNSNHCSGDSGGPYQKISSFGGSNRYVQYGVISTGSRYCSVLTELSKGMLVSYFMDWILDKMVLQD
uniref:Peptidase S1 domain-containing protein n=1 Tax=Anopheles dirus TaxID=7168 RepID=A0A182NS11_9DIPT